MTSLVGSFGRRVEYLRLSVSDRCNYRCFYCIPASGVPAGRRDEFLRHEELARLIRLFAGQGAVHPIHNMSMLGG